MATANEPRHHNNLPIDNIYRFIQSTATHLSSILPKPPPVPTNPSKLSSPVAFPAKKTVSLPITSLFEPTQFESRQSTSSSARSVSTEPGSGFPSRMRISGLNSTGKGGGPAFVGQVFSMCDLSGTGLMAVSTHFDIPFISKRTPEWLKKMFAAVTKSERNGPVFRFFMDLGDAVSYVKRLNIPSGVVGACRLDLAYEHFKEKPHLFEFIPNEKQVKEANKLLKAMKHNGQRNKVEGVPVFSAQNLDIAIATTDGIKWYTPYFFDKSMLDNILEESVDQHFHSLIKTRHLNRRQDIIDDSMAAEALEENSESIWEPPEVQEVMDEIGPVGIPFSVISKAAELQLLYSVDRLLLGNRWLRKATGIQPKFPYMVDSFEKRSAASLMRASESSTRVSNSELGTNCEQLEYLSTSEVERQDNLPVSHRDRQDLSDERMQKTSSEKIKEQVHLSPFLPKITMVGISTGEAGHMSKANLKKTMDDLTKELEQTDQANGHSNSEFKYEDRDPLFVANVGDYYSGMSKAGTARWVRGGAS